MTTLWIDDQQVNVDEGTTILDAARQLKIRIPTMCYREGIEPRTSCFLCVVEVDGRANLLPACATPVAEGIRVRTDSEKVLTARRTALELLLSEHLGDCEAPCHSACPAHMDIPQMITYIAAGELDKAIAVVKADIALPAVLGRICPAPCEKICRRASADEPVSIMELKRYVADHDLAQPSPYAPRKVEPTGKRVLVAGAGPAGLSAAWYLLQAGHTVEIIDDRAQLGGQLRYGVQAEDLPRDVLDAEIRRIGDYGAVFRQGVKLGRDLSLDDALRDFDAVAIAVGRISAVTAEELGLDGDERGVKVALPSHAASRPGVFAGGNCIGAARLAVRAGAHGKAMATSIDQFLRGEEPVGISRRLGVHIGRVTDEEVTRFMETANPIGRQPAGPSGLNDKAARAEATRCLHCECLKPKACRLRLYADRHDARTRKFSCERKVFRRVIRPGGLVFEPGKCIDCGLCVEITRRSPKAAGLTFVGRGFDVQVDAPMGLSFDEALGDVAAECVKACPTAALAMMPDRPGRRD